MRADSRATPALLPKARYSILTKVVGALVLALVLSTAVTAVVASRLTSNALGGQARRIATSQLTVLQEAFAERERTLLMNMRNLAETLNAGGLTDPARRPELIAELGRASGNLELELIRVLDGEGRELVPSAGVGTNLDGTSIFRDLGVTVEPGSRLLATREGRFVQAVATPVGAGATRLVLVGAYDFGDDFGYRLRRRIGSLDNVILVAGGTVAATTLPDPPRTPPGQRPGSGLPSSPTVVRLGDQPSLVAYVPVGRSADDPVGGALGVVLTNPISPLQRSLADARLVASVLLTLVALGLGWLLFRALIRPLVTLSATAGRIAAGDAGAAFEVRGSDEIAMLARSLEHMRLELRSKLELIARQAGELRETSQRIVAAQDEERHRLARDLHDGIQQQLVVLRMQIGMLQDGLGASAGDAPGLAVDNLGAELDRVISQLREVTHNLYPSILLDRGLGAALHSYAGRLPLTTHLRCEPEDFPRLAPEIESGAYFLLGEAVTNALKHAGATAVDISLRLSGGWLEVAVADDGRGFVVGEETRGGGLLHMEDRVRSFGGRLEITSAPGRGTRVVATFPERVGVSEGVGSLGWS